MTNTTSQCCKAPVELVMGLHTHQCGECGMRVSDQGTPMNEPHQLVRDVDDDAYATDTLLSIDDLIAMVEG
jgi:hypothetical protein